MEKTVKIGGHDIRIRGLKWREVQELKEQGCNLHMMNPYADNDELVLKVIETSCGSSDFIKETDMDAAEVYGLFKEIHGLTFVPPEKAKN